MATSIARTTFYVVALLTALLAIFVGSAQLGTHLSHPYVTTALETH
jgi:hypothetical protein